MTPSPPRTAVTVSIETSVAEALEEAADSRMVGKALLVQKALEAYLPTLPSIPGTEAATPEVEA